jgi:3-oxoacyl-[acyl-carrier-protein] synthase II
VTDLTQQVVITGAGLVSPLGLSRRETWNAIARGKCGMGPLSAMESPLAPGKDGGQAPDLPDDFEADAPREIRYLRWAIDQSLCDAGFNDSAKLPYPPHRCGLVVGTTLHGMRSGGKFLRSGDFSALQTFLATSVLQRATQHLNMTGLAATTCSACSSSLGSVALAVSLLQSGEFDLILAGGYDPISEYAYAGFNSLRLVAEGPLRPFGHNRQGMKLAEGYAIVVLERVGDATKRKANTLATILGCGESADAHHLTQPHPEGEGAARAMQAALADAHLEPRDVDLAAAHATGTPDNDAGEYAALSRVFGEDLKDKPVVAFKSHLGHTLGAAGAAELILAATALAEQTVPACLNANDPDPGFTRLRLATSLASSRKLNVTLNTSLGFGGANTSVILGRALEGEAPAEPRSVPKARLGSLRRVQSSRSLALPGDRPRDHQEVLITGIGVVLPNIIGRQALAQRCEPPAEAGGRLLSDTGAVAEESILPYLNARRVRRMSDYVKLSLAATALACRDAGIEGNAEFLESCSVILGSAHGAANYCHSYYKQIVDEGIAAANPMLFAEGVPNAAAAHLSLMLSLKGACQTVIGSRTAGLDALRLASTRIASGQWKRAVVGAAEEYCDIINEAYRHCGLYRGSTPAESGFVVGAGAVTFILEARESLERRGGKALGRVELNASRRFVQPDAIDATLQVLHELRDPQRIMSSANNTWIDRTESAAIRRANASASVAAMYGRIAETYSVGPLAAIASQLSAAVPSSDSFGVLCTDYTGLVAGARIRAET